MSLNFETESKTGFIRVSISRPIPRLKLSESQPRDRVRDHRIGRDRVRDQESRYTLNITVFFKEHSMIIILIFNLQNLLMCLHLDSMCHVIMCLCEK